MTNLLKTFALLLLAVTATGCVSNSTSVHNEQAHNAVSNLHSMIDPQLFKDSPSGQQAILKHINSLSTARQPSRNWTFGGVPTDFDGSMPVNCSDAHSEFLSRNEQYSAINRFVSGYGINRFVSGYGELVMHPPLSQCSYMYGRSHTYARSEHIAVVRINELTSFKMLQSADSSIKQTYSYQRFVVRANTHIGPIYTNMLFEYVQVKKEALMAQRKKEKDTAHYLPSKNIEWLDDTI